MAWTPSAEVAPLAKGRGFFRSVIITGSHPAGAEAVARDEADLAALDCVTWATSSAGDPTSPRA